MQASTQDTLIARWVRQRRTALARAAPAHGASAPAADDPLWGLALSGGGIRSATFSLGLVSGLAQKGLLHRFDLLSTVSGGGYIGAALGSAYQTAGMDALEVEKRLAAADRTWFVWWLRATSRYLTPRGAADLLVAAATYARNMVAVHLELGLAGLVLGALLALLNLFAWQALFGWFGAREGLLATVGPWLRPWLSTVWLLLVFPLLAAVPLASAYWTIQARRGRRWVVTELAFALALLVLGAAAAGVASQGDLWHGQRDGLVRGVCGGLAVLLLLAATGPAVARLARIERRRAAGAHARGHAPAPHPTQARGTAWQNFKRVLGTTVDTGAAAEQRNRLTTALAVCLWFVVALGLLGLIDRAAWFVSFERSHYTWLLPLVVAMGVAAVRTLAAQLPAHDPSAAVTGRLLFRIAEVAGLLLLAVLAIFWVAVVYRVALAHLFAPPPTGGLLFDEARQLACVFLALPLLYMLATCKKADFCNLSSLHMFYRARLTRSYLGAANPARFPRPPGATPPLFSPLDDADPPALAAVAERPRVFRVDPRDAMPMRRYRPHAVGGPVHLLNVTINQTRDPLGGLFNQDRKGQYLSVTSKGWYRVGLDGWQQDKSFLDSQLPAWMAISGAAVAPGLGGQTSAGLSVLLFMAGVRLGFWWEMEPPLAAWWRKLGAALSPNKYRLMYGEAFAQFGGTGDRFWYLSDGGHFENTGAYALLRQQARLVVVADGAADPQYAWGDLENLVRKARVDLQAQICFVDPSSAPRALPAFGSLEQLRDPESDACIALARITYRDGDCGWLVFVKPNMFRGLPVDVLNYKRDNPAFPQEPTADQFFSEPQWESYFRLGREIGLQLDGAVLAQLAANAPWTRMLANAPRPHAGAGAGAGAAGAAARKDTRFTERYPRAVGLARSGLSLTALAAVLTAAAQVWDKYASDAEGRQRAYWSEINAASALNERVLQGETKLAPELTARVASIAATYCREGAQRVASDPQAAGIYGNVFKRCAERAGEDPPPPASPACAVLREVTVQRCLSGVGREGQPAYWGIAYDDVPWALERVKVVPEGQGDTVMARVRHGLAQALAAAVEWPARLAGRLGPGVQTTTVALGPPAAGRAAGRAPASVEPSPAPPPAPAPAPSPAPAPAASPAVPASAAGPAPQLPHCSRKLVYLQIYRNEDRGTADALAARLRAAGARAPGVENVTATAMRSGRNAPRPVQLPTIIFHTPDEEECANELRQAQPGAVVRPLSGGLVGTPGVLEVWLPPGDGVSSTGS